jgi:predicted lipid-binding transport protein (Tim44 family)
MPKHPRDWTTEEALRKLFHPKVVEHLKKASKEASEKGEKSTESDSTS